MFKNYLQPLFGEILLADLLEYVCQILMVRFGEPWNLSGARGRSGGRSSDLGTRPRTLRNVGRVAIVVGAIGVVLLANARAQEFPKRCQQS